MIRRGNTVTKYNVCLTNLTRNGMLQKCMRQITFLHATCDWQSVKSSTVRLNGYNLNMVKTTTHFKKNESEKFKTSCGETHIGVFSLYQDCRDETETSGNPTEIW